MQTFGVQKTKYKIFITQSVNLLSSTHNKDRVNY